MGLKIYLVENDLDFGKELIKTLKLSDHCVRKWYKSLRPEDNPPSAREIKAKYEEGEFDLALIDQRGAYDDFDLDVSGRRFAKKLCEFGIPTILITNYLPSEADIFKLIRTGELRGVLDKALEPFEIDACFQHYELNRHFPNGFAEFNYKGDELAAPGFWSYLENSLKIALEAETKRIELARLFRSLISPCATKVELEEVRSGRGGAMVVKAEVSSGDGPVVEELAIKYGERKIIKSEEMRYDRFVGPLPDGAVAQLRWRSETEHLGALAYSWVSDSTEDAIPISDWGSEGLPHLAWRVRRSAINRLFSVSLNRWYEIHRSRTNNHEQPQTLLKHYTGRGGLWYKKKNLDRDIRPHIEANRKEVGIERLVNGDWSFGYGRPLADPLEWVKQSGLTFRPRSPMHGDLHVANIFVLPDDSPRLIDFGRTELGHVYRDFVALETSIRQTCVSIADRELLGQAEDQICEAKTLGKHIDYRSLGEQREKQILEELKQLGDQDKRRKKRIRELKKQLKELRELREEQILEELKQLDDQDKRRKKRVKELKKQLRELRELREAVRVTMEIRHAALDAVGKQIDDRSMSEYLFAVVMHMLRYAMGTPDEIKGRDSRRKDRIWHALYAAAKAADLANKLNTKGNQTELEM